MATSQGEPVSSRATQLVTVISIRREKFQAKVESHRRRNSGCSRGRATSPKGSASPGTRTRRGRPACLPLSHREDCIQGGAGYGALLGVGAGVPGAGVPFASAAGSSKATRTVIPTRSSGGTSTRSITTG